MNKRFAITIARTLGSDGGEIARRVSQAMGIRFIDKELLNLASSESGINEALFSITDEKVNRKIFRQSTGAYRGEVYAPGSEDFLSNKNLFEYQSKVLRDLYNNDGQFVVVGRAASYILSEFSNVVRVNVVASEPYCVENIMDRNCIDEKQAQKLIAQTNKYRCEYFKYFTGKEWGDPKNYDICLNSETLGIENCVRIIMDTVKTILQDK